jgi:hypothetical protein
MLFIVTFNEYSILGRKQKNQMMRTKSYALLTATFIEMVVIFSLSDTLLFIALWGSIEKTNI